MIARSDVELLPMLAQGLRFSRLAIVNLPTRYSQPTARAEYPHS
jgi:hypothetical protein